MPSGANITVKKNDNTTDIVWTFFQSSSGEQPSIWRQEVSAMHTAGKPTMALSVKLNGNRTGKRFMVDFRHPQTYTNSTTGIVGVENILPITLTGLLPLSYPQALLDEAISQSMHLLASTAIKDCLKAGAAAT